MYTRKGQTKYFYYLQYKIVISCIITDKSLCDTSDIISDSSGVGTSNSDTVVTLPGTSVVCIENYTSTQPGHLRLSQGDVIEGNLYMSYVIYKQFLERICIKLKTFESSVEFHEEIDE